MISVMRTVSIVFVIALVYGILIPMVCLAVDGYGLKRKRRPSASKNYEPIDCSNRYFVWVSAT